MPIAQTSSDVAFSYPKISLLKNWIKAVINEENLIPGDITIVFCSDEYLLSVNQRYLKHDFYTDIITFDYTENNLISGDMFISIERVRENAASYSVDFFEELDRVIIHGVLHLIGYSDNDEKNSEVMRGKENHYLTMKLNKIV